jgi:hypothetical protein
MRTEPSLQRVQFNVSSTPDPGEIQEAEQHIRLPGPSLWPLLLGIAICVFVVGLMLLFISDFPWVALVSLLCVFIGIMGWAMENPDAKMKLESPVSLMSTMKLESPISLIPTMKLESPISLMPTMKLESPISLIPTVKLNAIQANIQGSTVHPVESDSTPGNSYQAKKAQGNPTASQDSLYQNKFHRY